MKKSIIRSIILLVLAVSTFAQNAYADDTFSTNLQYGSKGSDVIKLQTFLSSQGFLSNTLVTGNFLSLTKKALIEFQKINNVVPSVGYFGPLTRAIANQKTLLAQNSKSSVSIVSVSAESNTASLIMSGSKKIIWKTKDYPVSAGIDINLLRKISDNPISYEFVEKIAKDTQNDGQETWIPKKNQTGNDLYIEITCSTTYKFVDGCSSMGVPTKVF